MERSVGEHMTESSQPCRKGQNRARISALEAAYGEYRLRCAVLIRARRVWEVG